MGNNDFCGQYLNWLNNNMFQVKMSEDTFRVSLPFLDRNNDFVDIYIIDHKDGTFTLTDDGDTINDLKSSGFDFLSGQRRFSILETVISSHGVTRLPDDSLTISCNADSLPSKKHLLAQCMVKISDMFYLSKNNVQSIFTEDIQKFLSINNIRYVDNINVVGKSKLNTHYDFIIAHSSQAPERLLKVVNTMNLDAARNLIFAWNDTREMRGPDSKLYAFINDEKIVSEDALEALKQYEIVPALWSQKDSYITELSA